MSRKPMQMYWWVAPLPLLLIAIFVSWRTGAHGIGVMDAFKLGDKPPEFVIAKLAVIGVGLMAVGVLSMFLTKGTPTGVVAACLTGICAVLFVAIGATAYTDLQGPTGTDALHMSIGFPLYELGCIATLLLSIQVARSAPGHAD